MSHFIHFLHKKSNEPCNESSEITLTYDSYKIPLAVIADEPIESTAVSSVVQSFSILHHYRIWSYSGSLTEVWKIFRRNGGNSHTFSEERVEPTLFWEFLFLPIRISFREFSILFPRTQQILSPQTNCSAEEQQKINHIRDYIVKFRICSHITVFSTI